MGEEHVLMIMTAMEMVFVWTEVVCATAAMCVATALLSLSIS